MKKDVDIMVVLAVILSIIIVTLIISNILSSKNTEFDNECEERYPNNSITYCDEVFCKCLPKSCLAYRDPTEYNNCINQTNQKVLI